MSGMVATTGDSLDVFSDHGNPITSRNQDYNASNGPSDLGYNLSNRTYDPYIHYDYDYDASVSSIPMKEFIPVVMVYGVTLLLGVLGNTLVIVSIARYKRMQTVTNIFLTSLASADLLLVMLCIPIKLAKWFTFSWTFGEVLCKLVHYLQNVSVICSILTLTAISLERYHAIVHPMKAKYTCTLYRARRVIVVLWILSFVVAAPILVGQVHKEVGLSRKAFWCVKEWPSFWQGQLYASAMLTFIFVFPVAFMTFAYFGICREMSRMRKDSSGQCIIRSNNECCRVESTGEYESWLDRSHARPPRQYIRKARDDSRTRKQVIRMLVAIITLFVICWGPLLIDNLLVAFKLVSKLHYEHLKPMRQAFALLAYSNSCINPVVYAFMSRHFRNTFLSTLYGFLRRKRDRQRAEYNFQRSLMAAASSSSKPRTSYPVLTSWEKPKIFIGCESYNSGRMHDRRDLDSTTL